MAASTPPATSASNIGIDGRASADWHPQGQPAWRFDTTFDGDLDTLPLKLDIAKPFHAHVDGKAEDLTSKWRLSGNGATSDLDISVWGAGTFLGIIAAQVAITADADGFSAKGPVTAPGLKAGPIQLDFHGAYSDHRLTIRDTTAVHLPSGSRATVRGTADVVANGPRLALTGEWSTLTWPLLGKEPAFTSRQGHYSLEGLRPWTARAEGEVTAAGISDMPGTVIGKLGTDTFTIEAGTLGLYGGNAKVTGEVRWRPAESWNVAGRITGFNPALVREDLPGRLDFDFSAKGAPFGGAGSIDFNMARLDGKLRGLAASGGGRFEKPAGSENWLFHQVDVKAGRARLQLDGSYAEPRDLNFAIDADDLSIIDARARGRLSARGRYAGTDEAPVLLFKARGANFAWEDYKAESIDADVDLDLRNAGRAIGKIDLAGVTIGTRTVRTAAFEVSGTGKSQRVALTIDAMPLRAKLSAEGGMEGGLWRGSIQDLTVNDETNLALRLKQPATLALSAEQIELGDLCMTDLAANGCISGHRFPDGRWSTVFSVQQIPLNAFTAGLSQNMDYEGTINLAGELAGGSSGLPTGSLSGELANAQLIHLLSNGQKERLPLGSGTIKATATTTGFSGEVALDASGSNIIKGKLTGERNSGDWHEYPVRGELQARTDGLSMLDMYVGGIDKATGELDTDVDISGTLGNPRLAGRVQLRNASIDIYQVGTALRELTLDARFDRQSLDVSGQSRVGGGMAKFNGKLAWRDGEPYGDLHVEGDRLRIIDVPEARIDASPNLNFKLSGRHVNVTGEVVIPKAQLEPADLANAVLASDDERLVDEDEPDPEQRWLVTSNIRMRLGDDVSMDALGLTATLGGDVTVRTDEAGNSRGQGELNIKSGRYMAYGRLLDIERGRLIYRNVPLNDPGVELRAQKQFPDVYSGTVIAGVNVRGTLRNRQLTFFSDSELSQSQIASLILAGGAVDSAQNSQRSGAARNELLAQAGAILAQRVGSGIGVDDIGVESSLGDPASATAGDTSLVLGKYLSPRLYVSYGISLAEAIDTFKMRWTLGKGWTVKTEAGRARSADIVYTFKKGKKDAEKK
jgi:translocation and assembly module TamB